MQTNDITVGIVNSFKGKDIKKNMPSPIREIPRKSGEPSDLPDESRPFVCVGHRNGISQWAEITTESREERLEIAENWRTWQDGDSAHKPTARWKRDIQYINSAVFEGPDNVWAPKAQNHNTTGHFKIVTPEGIAAIRDHLQENLTESLFPLP